MTYNELCEMMLYHRIIEWDDNYIKLDNGMELRIEETEQDCCASAYGYFTNVELDAAITNIGDIKYNHWEDDDTYGCSATITIMHNRNIICQAIANADAGNGGYYYSVASFVVSLPNSQKEIVHFVGSEDGD